MAAQQPNRSTWQVRNWQDNIRQARGLERRWPAAKGRAVWKAMGGLKPHNWLGGVALLLVALHVEAFPSAYGTALFMAVNCKCTRLCDCLWYGDRISWETIFTFNKSVNWNTDLTIQPGMVSKLPCRPCVLVTISFLIKTLRDPVHTIFLSLIFHFVIPTLIPPSSATTTYSHNTSSNQSFHRNP